MHADLYLRDSSRVRTAHHDSVIGPAGVEELESGAELQRHAIKGLKNSSASTTKQRTWPTTKKGP